MFCGFCGNMLPDGAVFCTNCGNRLMQQGQSPSVNNNQNFTRMDPQQGTYNQASSQDMYNQAPQGGYNQGYNQGYSQGAYGQVPPQGGYDHGGYYQAPQGGYNPDPQYYNQGGQYIPPQGGNAGAAVGRAAAGAAKHASHLGLIIGLCAAAVAVVLVVVLVVVPAVTGRSVEQTVAQLEESMSKLDMDGMMECFDSDSQQMFSATKSIMDGAMGIADSLFDTNVGDLYGIAEGLGGILGATGLGPDVSIDIVNKNQTSDTTCIVSTYITISMPSIYGLGSDGTQSEYMDLYMVKEGNDWCISLMNTPEMQQLFNSLGY